MQESEKSLPSELNEDLATLILDLKNATTWQTAYEIGKTLYSKSSGEIDENVKDAFESAFDLGLNVHSARQQFLDATQIVARLYFKYQDYVKALNKLLLLVANEDNLPEWVHLYLASAQIHTDNLFRIAEDPSFFFARLDRVNADNQQELDRRNSILKELLILMVDQLKGATLASDVGIRIIDKAISYELNASSELLLFRDSFCPDIEISKLDTVPADDEDFPTIEIGLLEEQQIEEIEHLESEREQLIAQAEWQKDLLDEHVDNVQSVDKLVEEIERNKREISAKNQEISAKNQEIERLYELLSHSQKPITDVQNVLSRNQKLLVIGGTEVKERILMGVAKAHSNFIKGDIEFVLEYDKIRMYTTRIKPWGTNYAGIIVGPCPHKTGDSGDFSSFIQKIKEEEGYPHIEEARELGGQLKLTKQSFRLALDRMVTHWQSIT